MGTTWIATLLAIGGAAWVYSKMMKQTGSQAKPALTVAAVAAVFIFALTFILMSFLPD